MHLIPRRRTGRVLPALSAVLVTAAAFTGLSAFPGLATAASAATTTDPAKVGLYGSQDPTFDGVYRQSLAILALVAAGGTPAPEAVTWLKKQQCADGGFESFRSPLTAACLAPSSTVFHGEDSNSTAIAAQALHALGDATDASRAVTWLGNRLNSDGGWAYYPDGAAGNASDANSTALGLSAFYALGRALPKNGSNVSPLDFLQTLQVGCSGTAADQGAFTFFGSANDYASVQAALAVVGGFLPVAFASGDNAEPVIACPASTLTQAQAADAASGYLARRLQANGNAIPDSVNPAKTDYASTANAVLALVRIGHGSGQVTAALGVLAANQLAFTHASGADVPGALADLILAAVAGGQNPATFGGSNLVSRLQATVTTAAVKPTPKPTSKPTPKPTAKSSASPTQVTTGGSDPGSADPTLPKTGSDSRVVATTATGTGLLLAGALLVLGARRKSRPGRH
jgi:LPXTG-motif cell wall-anchored protein